MEQEIERKKFEREKAPEGKVAIIMKGSGYTLMPLHGKGGKFMPDVSFIDTAEFELLKKGERQVRDGELVQPAPVDKQAEALKKERHAQIGNITQWFAWYDVQVSQALRAVRLGEAWSAEKDGVTYTTLTGLDAEAATKQAEMRVLRAQTQS